MLNLGDQIIEINGENVERESHDIIVEKIKRSGNEVTFLVVESDAAEYFRSKDIIISSALLTSKRDDEAGKNRNISRQ